MNFQLHPYAVVLFFSAITTLLTSVIILRRDMPGARMLGASLAASFIWGGAYAMSWSLTTLHAKLIWVQVACIGAVASPALFLVFTLQITHHPNWLSRRNIILLALVPALSLILVWFRPDLFFGWFTLIQKNGFAVLQLGRGVGFWIFTLYSYGLILLALSMLGTNARHANLFFRRQYLIILLAAILPFSTSIFTQIIFRQLADLDLAPIVSSVSGILLAYAMVRHQLMDLLPIARGRLIESMSDGVLVLDAQDRIVDINPAMKKLLSENGTSWLGREFGAILKTWAQNAEQLLNGRETRTEIKLPHQPSQYLDLRITPLFDERHTLNGRLIVFRDVSDRKEVERDLRRAMDRLQTQLIEIGVLQSQLREQAIRDALTNVFNRRYLEDTLARELARAERENYPLCVIMMDLDYFKDVNDTYGHEAGDQVLKALAETVTRQSRHGDFVCRYGGEEFVLVMPNIGLETALLRAEELHETINAMNITYGVFTLSTTISMGVAMYPEHGRTKEQLLRAADRAMYIAKNTGRNKVVVYPESQLS